MKRLTITLSDEKHRALKEASAEREKTIGELIEESLEFYGIKSRAEAAEIVAQARKSAGMREEEALGLAVEETRRERAR